MHHRQICCITCSTTLDWICRTRMRTGRYTGTGKIRAARPGGRRRMAGKALSRRKSAAPETLGTRQDRPPWPDRQAAVVRDRRPPLGSAASARRHARGSRDDGLAKPDTGACRHVRAEPPRSPGAAAPVRRTWRPATTPQPRPVPARIAAARAAMGQSSHRKRAFAPPQAAKPVAAFQFRYSRAASRLNSPSRAAASVRSRSAPSAPRLRSSALR